MSIIANQIEILSDRHFTVRREAADVTKALGEIANVIGFLIFRADGDTSGRSIVEGQKIWKMLSLELADLEYQLSDIEDDLAFMRGE